MSEDIEIVHARSDQYGRVAAMHYAVWRETYSAHLRDADLDKFDPRDWAENVYPDLVSDGRAILFAESDNEPVGVLIYRPDVLDPHDLEIEALYVANERRGIGRRMMEVAIAQRPWPKVVVACTKENWVARRFYGEKLGFQRDTDPRRDRYWKPEDLPAVKVPLIWYVLDRTKATEDRAEGIGH